ncbi:MAG: efflux RND transporter periplasmic adaptor subunit [Algoriphagus sp.]|jgi:RND family efflux transporter MFP subunit|nr:efflux RND transporter periplasmic adaptor subunit [Algoriphagus sp.]
MKKISIILLLVVAAGAVAFTLYTNKTEMEAATETAMKSSEFVPVTLEKVASKTMETSFESNGVFEANQELTLMAETGGAVVKINKRKGDFVRAGDLILQIDDRLIQAELTVALLNLDQTKKDLQRFSNLVDSDAITKKQFEDTERAFKIAEAQLKAIRKRAEDTQIKAPISGYINEDYYEPGTLVSPGMPLAELINTNPLKLNLNVSEREVATVRLGQKVNVKVNALPNAPQQGIVKFISNKADGAFKYEVILEITSPSPAIKPGMFGTATFTNSDTADRLLISRKSLVGGLKNPGVYIVANGVAVYRSVQIQPINASLVAVTEGLSAGDEIIASGLINVKDGIKVKAQ